MGGGKVSDARELRHEPEVCTAGDGVGPMPLVLLFLLSAALRGADLPQWRETTVTDSLKMGYQLVAADLNRDGRPDLIAVDERATELAWYENPTWARHVLIKDVPRTINLDVYDYDGDGIPEIAMGHNFETVPEKSIGNVLILKSGPDLRQPWTEADPRRERKVRAHANEQWTPVFVVQVEVVLVHLGEARQRLAGRP